MRVRGRIARSLQNAVAEAALRDTHPPPAEIDTAADEARDRGLMIRTAVPADFDQIIEVQARANATSRSHIFDEANRLPEAAIARRWRAALDSGDFRFAVCTDGDAIIGVSHVGGFWFHGLVVAPEYWGTPVARLLHDDALAALRASGERRVLARVMERNHRARAFWTKHGWTLLPWRPTLSQYPPHPRVLTYALRLDVTSPRAAQALVGQVLLRFGGARYVSVEDELRTEAAAAAASPDRHDRHRA